MRYVIVNESEKPYTSNNADIIVMNVTKGEDCEKYIRTGKRMRPDKLIHIRCDGVFVEIKEDVDNVSESLEQQASVTENVSRRFKQGR